MGQNNNNNVVIHLVIFDLHWDVRPGATKYSRVQDDRLTMADTKISEKC